MSISILGRGAIPRIARTRKPAARAPETFTAVTWVFLEHAVRWLLRDAALRRSRRALLDLTDEQLRDVGLTRRQALAEGRRSLYLD